MKSKQKITFLPQQTKRLLLRHFNLQDVPSFQRIRADIELAKYQGWLPMSQQQTRAFIKEQESQVFGPEGVWLQIAIEEKKPTNSSAI